MPQTIVFDLFGVIARTQTEEARGRIERLAGVTGEPFWAAYWAGRAAYDAGQSSQEYWMETAARLGVSFSASTVQALVQADLESWTRVDERMVELVAELAGQGRVLGLLSNIIEDLVPMFEGIHGHWLGHFTALTYSCRIGVAKPDPQAYEICARRLGVAPADVLFFDDSERNVVAARETGMTAEVFTSPEQVRKILAEAR
ncbi:HAD family hydrolase [Actinomadura sp. HBU206391]|uniref:HAD family hydrolase n=1 Tax=Actinomadura sp. HBU206391 TaxID=2731692 RepID=UPI0016500D2D|nr:HAD family phosphatase [Actinomadura sp. HBU206391]MBC6460254.1 HAD family phosphatase [Actinomadura sp. HBU206391]